MVFLLNINTLGEAMGRGVSSPVSAAIISFAIIALAIYTTLLTTNSMVQVYRLLKNPYNVECSYLRIASAVLYPNSTMEIVIDNDGPNTINDISSLGMVVVIYANESQYTYTLKNCNTLSHGCWFAEKIVAGFATLGYGVGKPFRPGEKLYAKALLGLNTSSISYGYVAIFSSCSKAERVIVSSNG